MGVKAEQLVIEVGLYLVHDAEECTGVSLVEHHGHDDIRVVHDQALPRML